MGEPFPSQPKLTDEEVVARLIEIGNIPMPKVHTVWNVANPYSKNQKLSDILYSRAASHYNYYSANITFDQMNCLTQYKQEDFSLALKDALARMIKFGFANSFMHLELIEIRK